MALPLPARVLLLAIPPRFIPRHEDELELDVDDPILVELEEDDYWYRGYNMRTGERGIFPAFYAHEVVGQARDAIGRSLRGPGGRRGVAGAVGLRGTRGAQGAVSSSPLPAQA